MNVSSQPSAATAPSAKMPGEVVRGLVSLWLIIHFLGILLAVFTNNEDLGRSQLLNRLKQVPPLDQYIYALWLDVPYNNYYLANGSPLDADFSLRLDLLDENGEKIEELQWPPPDTWFGERRERFARLAFRAADAGDRQDLSVAATVGKGVLDRTGENDGAKDLVFNVWRHQPLGIEDARSSDPALRDPSHDRTFSRTHTANVRLNINGDPEVKVPQEAVDVAAPNQPASTKSLPNQNGRGSESTPTRRASEGESSTAPDAARSKPRRQRADPLPQPERSKKTFTVPRSLFRPSDPATDPSVPPK